MDFQKNKRQSRTALAGKCRIEVAPEIEELEPFLLSGGGGESKGNGDMEKERPDSVSTSRG